MTGIQKFFYMVILFVFLFFLVVDGSGKLILKRKKNLYISYNFLPFLVIFLYFYFTLQQRLQRLQGSVLLNLIVIKNM